MTRVLLTAFEPFGGDSVNPSERAVADVVAVHPPGVEVVSSRLSCVFSVALDELTAAVARTEPDVVICTGQAGGRPDVTVERIAINVDDARIPDNAGRQPVDRPVVEGGPAAYFSTLPVKACVAAARAAGVPASVSQTAGTFVCNHVFYGLMHLMATQRPHMRGGFVHLPYAPEQVTDRAQPSLPVTLAAEGLRAVVTAAASRTEDIVVAGGATH
ncbi:pyroglutamyl-peptidase I [Streptomyces sp. RB6PN25]|uniref:Pyrrolidone-carboxylate peptidase n=1 Tax=Streptomyces humicola TaxID=2953240 RepID=A0ABT1Q2M1_9ACTN|nr:pyroglutamyl-peptidase I [Streptomyces humicola]MCQ4083560.1 pyroglutamyl-peptidase I [Streptomyces humicola]